MTTETVTAAPASTNDASCERRRSLDTYRLLGRSGLRVSPLALGTMTFGTDWGWGPTQDETREIFDAYVERGGNFIDTANVYTNGTSERLLGEFARDRRDRLGDRDQVHDLDPRPATPTPAATTARTWSRSVEASLKRLRHRLHRPALPAHLGRPTPVEEILRGLDDLVRAGQGALRRHLRHPGLAGRPHAGDRRAARLDAARRPADRVQPDRAHRRARPDPDGARDGPGRAPLVAAGQRAC